MEVFTEAINISVSIALIVAVIPKIGLTFFQAWNSFVEAGGEEGEFYFKVFEVMLLMLLLFFQGVMRIK